VFPVFGGVPNAGDATMKGVEVGMQAVVGNGLSFNLSGGYIDADYDFINPDTLIPAGERRVRADSRRHQPDERSLPDTGSINLGAGQMSGSYNRPKEWYLTVRAKFGGK
jgi:outer membrane receptor protein involved in Fe transport